MSKPMNIGDTVAHYPDRPVSGGYVNLLGESFYCIRNYDRMAPFFMSLVSSSDHWMFISSSGGLSAGRANAESALFPYYTDDKLTENAHNTGPVSVFRVSRGAATFLWQPFSDCHAGVYDIERNLYKNSYGDKLVFEEINHSLELACRYAWRTSDRYGFVKTSWLANQSGEACQVEVLDGVQNILPCGVASAKQNTFSNLLNAYKRNELEPETGLGMFSLSSTLTDLAEPSEALRATTVWQFGLERSGVLLSAGQVENFRRGGEISPETDVRSGRGAYLVHANVELAPGRQKEWSLVAQGNQDAFRVAELLHGLKQDAAGIFAEVERDIAQGTEKLVTIVAAADGLQASGEHLSTAHHFSNVLFNTMRGGIFAQNYAVEKADLLEFVAARNTAVLKHKAAFFADLPTEIQSDALLNLATASGSADLERLCYEYLPLTFGRRHGDPSRPWNRFSINLKKADGSPRLDYEGNWRDIFQNWEPLAWSYPQFVEQMVVKFLNATTADGYNPYRVTRAGVDWEAPSPEDPWANIGYWNDHQIIYLEKLMEVSARFHPGRLQALLDRRVFSHVNVPYRIKEYAAILHDPYSTITFDHALQEKIGKRVAAQGTDGKLVQDAAGQVFYVTMGEKLLVLLLAKLGNFVPEGGIGMNAQRPEWNDANNALVGKGLSVVTLGYLLRYIAFCQDLLADAQCPEIPVTRETKAWFDATLGAFARFQDVLRSAFSDEQRRSMMDALGQASSEYRWNYYRTGLSGEFALLAKNDLLSFLALIRRYVEHSLRANQRPNQLFHAYNILHLHPGQAVVGNLYEMLEGQVSILSSGLLDGEQALALLRSLRVSKMYRPDQHSYLLYPDRDQAGFLKKNRVSAEQVRGLGLVKRLDQLGDRSLIARDVDGVYHFNGIFRNAKDVRGALQALKEKEGLATLVEAESGKVLELFEQVFDHNSFTGRSGTFFAYEGLGSIYWHDAYYDIRKGLGFNKSPEVYGAFPTDPYSHTPAGQGAKQPGMTGQVKEEILTRLAELGLFVKQGCISFDPVLLREQEFSSQPLTFNYVDVQGLPGTIALPAGTLAYTFCQVPVVCLRAGQPRIELSLADGISRQIPGHSLDTETSQTIFRRTGRVVRITVFC